MPSIWTKLDQAQTSPWHCGGDPAQCERSVRVCGTRQRRWIIWRATPTATICCSCIEARGEFRCDYGHLTLAAGDYVVIPRGTMWRIELKEPMFALLIEATNSSYSLPDKGLLGGHAIFDPAMLDVPRMDAAFVAQQSDDRHWQVRVKRNNAISTVTYPFNPLDATGWHGDLSVVRINVKDIRPVASHRYHLPPSAHTTFVGNRFVICTFVPRPFETDPGALKVPFFHNNDDYDEVLFYHAGDFFSRDNIKPGMMTLHPCGFHAWPASEGAEEHARAVEAGDG